MVETRIVVPSETELQEAINEIKDSEPDFGIPRVCAALRTSHSTWQVSEKRVRKFMGSMGLIQTGGDQNIVPKSSVAPGDFVTTLAKGQVEVKHIDNTKGKGVFATCDFNQKVNVFEETPFAWYPRWDTVGMGYHRGSDQKCQLCAREIERRGRGPRPVKCNGCTGWFCSSICKKEAEAKFHQIECAKNNPMFVELADACYKWDWGAPMAAARAIERVLMEFEKSTEEGRLAWESLKAFTTVRADIMDMRRKGASWFLYEEDYRTKWKTTHALMRSSLFPPPVACGLTQFDKIPKKVRDEMFSYNEWLNLIGKYSLNDQNGGFYLLQSCFNHNCDPNCVVVHPNNGNYRAIIQTLRPIKAGEEMTITYVNPRGSVGERQQVLRDWYMFDCRCDRCVKESSQTNK
ncbi:hypothetical protein GGI25_004430 [Coemansia spiralis]|uniref:Histone-lysine N-methyltransferase SET5 n=2 Tax=Coemansia TaxID=4863 RepID=A0A9W8KX40_9FUNG|nr:hypothetical protein EDC05_001610 [Coemansia umbellata]KAJ2624281.1 hypothetical protein GGI26_001637 [Coemansia sp. RSA 1358]KAJ2674213.1 hypothetical protein GGI25_004430 [Coemansia spiralis]